MPFPFPLGAENSSRPERHAARGGRQHQPPPPLQLIKGVWARARFYQARRIIIAAWLASARLANHRGIARTAAAAREAASFANRAMCGRQFKLQFKQTRVTFYAPPNFARSLSRRATKTYKQPEHANQQLLSRRLLFLLCRRNMGQP